MRISRSIRWTIAVCLISLSPAAAAAAAPIAVNLRVEGSAKTLFEGPVSTDAETFSTASSNGEHPCDYHHNGSAEGFENEGVFSGTPTTALRDAALSAGLPFDAKWFGSGPEGKGNPGDFFVAQVGPDSNETSGSFASWGYAVNYLTSNVGGCQIALAPGSEVLWAYNYFNLAHRLSLSSPASAAVGVPFSVHVVDGSTGAPQPGVAIGEVAAGVTTTIPGSSATDAAGNATIVLSRAGTPTLKATAPGAVRSNGVPVCVHNGEDGTCQTKVPVPAGKSEPHVQAVDLAEVAGIASGRVFPRRSAPRLLRGRVHVPAGATLKDVRISLQRRVAHHCSTFSGTRGRFVRSGCGRRRFFSVGDSLSFSYLLPARLPTGRYVYDIEAIESSGRATTVGTGTSHVVFRVR
jgi:hypothetical protein